MSVWVAHGLDGHGHGESCRHPGSCSKPRYLHLCEGVQAWGKTFKLCPQKQISVGNYFCCYTGEVENNYFLSLGYGFIGNKDRNTQEHFLSWGCLTQHISVFVGFWCACSSAESAGVMTSRAWNPQGDPSQQDLQMFALGVFPKYPGF